MIQNRIIYRTCWLDCIGLTWLLVWQGIDEIFALIKRIRLFHYYCYAYSLVSEFDRCGQSPGSYLFPIKRTPAFKDSYFLSHCGWVEPSIPCLPVATIGGEIAKARLLILWGQPGGVDASASVLVDKTVQALALVPWAIIGTSLLVYLAIDNELAKLIMLGTFLLGLRHRRLCAGTTSGHVRVYSPHNWQIQYLRRLGQDHE